MEISHATAVDQIMWNVISVCMVLLTFSNSETHRTTKKATYFRGALEY